MQLEREKKVEEKKNKKIDSLQVLDRKIKPEKKGEELLLFFCLIPSITL